MQKYLLIKFHFLIFQKYSNNVILSWQKKYWLSCWLRIFGYDTLEIRKQENEDNVLLDLAEKEDRILISRDSLFIRKAIRKGIKAYLVHSSEILEQLREMRLEFQLNFEPTMNRCTLCNSLIRKIEHFEMEILETKEYVYLEKLEKGTKFWICDNCGQVYWKGAHWKKIMESANILKKVLQINDSTTASNFLYLKEAPHIEPKNLCVEKRSMSFSACPEAFQDRGNYR